MEKFEEVVAIPRSEAEQVLAALRAFFDMKTTDIDEVNSVLADLKVALGIMQDVMG